MKTILYLLPVIFVSIGFLARRYGGKKELLKIDLVQFIYAFILMPMVIIWLKTFLFFNLRNQLGISLNIEDRFLIDTIITTLSLYIFAFLVIHSLTKSFQIKKSQDPLFDIYELSEYFHLWLSHSVTYSGSLFIVAFLGILNLFLPLTYGGSRVVLPFSIISGITLGIFFYLALLMYKVTEQRKFDKLIKLQLYVYSLIFLSFYMIIRPRFNSIHAIFWCALSYFITAAIMSQTIKRKRLWKLFE